MGAQDRLVYLLDTALISIFVLRDGQGNEGNESNESNGCHESHEGNEEEANLCKACQASCLLRQDRQDTDWIEEVRPCADQDWQDRQQEEIPSWQEVTMDRSCPESP